MIERVARAMEPDVWASIDGDFWDGKERTRENSLARARAAIAAMREPTPEITARFVRAGHGPYGDVEARAVWQEMIDAALTASD